MRIGLLSDSHGHADTTARAVRLLLVHRAELILHLGDVGSETVIDELVGHNARLVFGNCDDEVASLARYAELVGVAVDHPMGRLHVAGKSLAYTHGHMQHLVDKALAEKPDYLFHGHSHEIRDQRVGETRIINPGALFRAPRYTAAVLDTGCDRLEIVDVARS